MKAKRPVRCRKLRIAWSVGWSVAAVLLIVLWVRSYWKYDALSIPQDNGCRSEITSACGEIRWANDYFDEPLSEVSVISKSLNDPTLFQGDSLDYPAIPTYRGLIVRDDYNHTYVPHWYPILAFVMLAAISWLPWSKRFSVRTLLIATTLVAVALGMIVYAARN